MGKKQEECALFGVIDHDEALSYCVTGLFSMQHRGEEGSGVSFLNTEGEVQSYKNLGLVSEVYSADKLQALPHSRHVIGHNRYSITGGNFIQNVQPFQGETLEGNSFSVAHNGNLINVLELREKLDNLTHFQTQVDTEIVVHMIANNSKTLFEEKLQEILPQLKGSFCFLILTEESLFVIRDSYGIRPLSIGKMDNSFITSSETCGISAIKGTYIRDIKPGECLKVDLNSGAQTSFFFQKQVPYSPCIFELIYFSRPDSIVFGQSVYEYRKELGKKLAQKRKIEADMVIPIPDSGIYSAIGYSQESKIPYEQATIRSHYVGRSFIQPSQEQRIKTVDLKHSPVSSFLKGKRVIVIDDSIVRGTTSKTYVKLLRDSGVKEIHFLIISPPVSHPCFYGVDFPSKKELIIHQKSIKEIEEYLDVDTLQYAELEDIISAIPHKNACKACFSGEYPAKVSEVVHKEILS